MKEPKRIPLTDNPRSKEPKKIPLTKQYIESIQDDLWDRHETNNSPPIFSKKQNENNQQDNTTSIQQLESDKTD